MIIVVSSGFLFEIIISEVLHPCCVVSISFYPPLPLGD
jgi:hypothetical protein